VLELGPPASGAPTIDLLVVDGHPVVLEGLRGFLATASVRIVADAATGEEAVRLARALQPRVALLDPWLPDLLPADVVEGIRAASPATRIVFFACEVTPSLLELAEDLGVGGVLGKDTTAQRLLEVVIRVGQGEVVADPVRAEALRRAAEKLRCTPLTPREHETLCRAAHGASNADIADALHLAPTTVKSYLQSALRKLGARNRAEAVHILGELRLL
jgi:DNA-binding NarL/FixJ family response regulator